MEKKSKVLALKYRPQTFDQLVGQKVIGESLFNSIKNNRIHEIDSSIILQPGPASLTEGLKVLESLIREQ